MISQIRLLEVELFSFCNRTCSFCPNSFIDRLSDNKILSKDTFSKLLVELKEHNFKGVISFSRYCEPFAHRNILEDRIKIVRQILPKVKLVCNTNGDYDWEGIDLDEVTIMDYDNNLDKSELGLFTRTEKPFIVRKMRLGKINNRAGALEKIRSRYIRTAPCYEPTYFVGIDYNGEVSPCCNIRSDINLHKPYMLGNIQTQSLTEILTADKSNKFRNKVASCNFDSICISCSKMPGRYTSDKPDIMNPTT